MPVAAPIIKRRGSKRKVNDASFFVYSYLAPGVYTTNVLISILRPGFITKLAGMRNSMKYPGKLTCNYVISPKVARS
jgi:hypothetical protein